MFLQKKVTETLIEDKNIHKCGKASLKNQDKVFNYVLTVTETIKTLVIFLDYI